MSEYEWECRTPGCGEPSGGAAASQEEAVAQFDEHARATHPGLSPLVHVEGPEPEPVTERAAADGNDALPA